MEIKCKCKKKCCKEILFAENSHNKKTVYFTINGIDDVFINRTDAAALVEELKKFIGEGK